MNYPGRARQALQDHVMEGTVYGRDLIPLIGTKLDDLVYTSYVSSKFPHTYEKQGLIFEVNRRPDSILAINSLILQGLFSKIKDRTDEKTAVKICRKFIFNEMTDFEKTDWREVHGHFVDIVQKYQFDKGIYITDSDFVAYTKKYPGCGYTEVMYKDKIEIKPLGAFGLDESKVKRVFSDAKVKPLPIYKTAKNYFEEIGEW